MSHLASPTSESEILLKSAWKRQYFQGAAGCDASASEALTPRASAKRRRARATAAAEGGPRLGEEPPAKCNPM